MTMDSKVLLIHKYYTSNSSPKILLTTYMAMSCYINDYSPNLQNRLSSHSNE